jgi:hypothetical protein
MLRMFAAETTVLTESRKATCSSSSLHTVRQSAMRCHATMMRYSGRM